MENFTTNMAVQNISKSKKEPTKTNQQEIITNDMLKKIKMIEKAFK